MVVQSLGDDEAGWDVQDGPVGTPVAAVVHDNALLVVTRDASGVSHLWRSLPGQ
jgi:hypothetical protein